MALRLLSARGLVAVLAVGLLAAGCNPDPGPTPTIPPTPGPTASPTATPSPTRTETAEEQRQREAFEAAEKAYRANFAEVGRLAMKGGAEEPTKVLRATSTGSYLTDQMSQLQLFKKQGLRTTSIGEVGWVRASGYSPGSLNLETCEDFRKVHLVNRDGATESPGANEGTRVYRQSITMIKTAGLWKASSFKTASQLKDCSS